MKRLVLLITLGALMLSLLGCKEEDVKKDIVILKTEFGKVNGGILQKSGFKLKPSDKELALSVEVDNNKGDDEVLLATWLYREGGSFNEVMRTDRPIEKGVQTIVFPLTSGKDLFYGEYMVEVYSDETLLTAERFWVLTEGKEIRNDIGLTQLTRCVTKTTESACTDDTSCSIVAFTPDVEKPSSWVCEPK